MKQLVCFLGLLLVTVAAFGKADELALDWQKGNNFYQQKQYDSAIFYYEKIVAQQPENALVYYNIGNAFYRKNKMADAVWNYELALHFSPNMSKAKDNLKLAKSRIPNAIVARKDIFFLRWWSAITSSNLAQFWAAISLILFLGLLLYLWLRKLQRIRLNLPKQIIVIGFLMVIVLLIFGYRSAVKKINFNKAVVMNNTATMYVSPGELKGQINVPEATTVWINFGKGGRLVAVLLPDKRWGWMKGNDIKRVQPQTQNK